MKHLLLVFSAVTFSIFFAKGQDSINPITQFLLKRGYIFPGSPKAKIIPDSLKKWPDTLYYNTTYKSKLLGSVSIPFYFSNVEIYHGTINLSPTINIGVGYTWFWGDFIFNEDDKITVDPKLYFGVMANTGLEYGLSLKQGGFLAGGFIGVSALTLFFGYDIINRSPSLGAGGRVDFYTLSQKFLHVIGKTKEVRKHRAIALPIAEE
jgi:hypothetical protein